MVLIARVFDLAIFRKNRKNLICVSVSVCMCVCVCVCVCVFMHGYVYVSINVTNQNNVIIAKCTRQYHIFFFEM